MTSARLPQPSLSDNAAKETSSQHNARSTQSNPLDAAASATARADLNKQNAASNAGVDASFSLPAALHPDIQSEIFPSNPGLPHAQVQFRSNTIAPSPPLAQSPSLDGLRLKTDDDPATSRYQPSPLNTDLANDVLRHSDVSAHPVPPHRTDSLNSNYGLSPSGSTRTSAIGIALKHKNSASSLKVSRTPSFKKGGYFGNHSAASSTVPSPIIAAMGDVTPLPSPLLVTDSPGPWRRMRRPSHEGPYGHRLSPPTADSVLVTSSGESVASAIAHQIKRKVYAGLGPEGGAQSGSEKIDEQIAQHGRNRSVSEYVPDPLQVPKRMVTVSGSHVKPGPETEGPNGHMRREPHLSEARGLTPIEKPPTPPPSESSHASTTTEPIDPGKGRQYEYFEARGRDDNKKRRWRSLKLLGQGTFSRVMLATSQITPSDDEGAANAGPLTPDPISQYDRRTLVAVKVCESGPKGGASEDRVEMSLKRELEIMQTIHHPSLIDLKAWNIEPTRALLVLSYCPGGDLFDVASSHRELLTPSLLRRMFAELVGAVKYLHERRIVHRDIKLENVLVNLAPSELLPTTDWATYPHSVITLTDLGLSRRVADDERLETRCGSDDYAAPEVIMGQAYDGRATDAWSLGVLLYALLEGRLPFDPHPAASDQHRLRSRTSHRIARVEWRWIEYAGDDGDHDGDEKKFEEKGLLGAMEITESLLKRARSRWTIEKVLGHDWVKGAIQVEGGIKFREEKEAEEVS